MYSTDISLNVVEPQQQSTPEPEQSPPEQEQPPPPENSGIPTEYIIAAAATVSIAGISVAAYLFMKKKK